MFHLLLDSQTNLCLCCHGPRSAEVHRQGLGWPHDAKWHQVAADPEEAPREWCTSRPWSPPSSWSIHSIEVVMQKPPISSLDEKLMACSFWSHLVCFMFMSIWFSTKCFTAFSGASFHVHVVQHIVLKIILSTKVLQTCVPDHMCQPMLEFFGLHCQAASPSVHQNCAMEDSHGMWLLHGFCCTISMMGTKWHCNAVPIDGSLAHTTWTSLWFLVTLAYGRPWGAPMYPNHAILGLAPGLLALGVLLLAKHFPWLSIPGGWTWFGKHWVLAWY